MTDKPKSTISDVDETAIRRLLHTALAHRWKVTCPWPFGYSDTARLVMPRDIHERYLYVQDRCGFRGGFIGVSTRFAARLIPTLEIPEAGLKSVTYHLRHNRGEQLFNFGTDGVGSVDPEAPQFDEFCAWVRKSHAICLQHQVTFELVTDALTASDTWPQLHKLVPWFAPMAASTCRFAKTRPYGESYYEQRAISSRLEENLRALMSSKSRARIWPSPSFTESLKKAGHIPEEVSASVALLCGAGDPIPAEITERPEVTAAVSYNRSAWAAHTTTW